MRFGLDRQGVPRLQIVEVLLHDHIASAHEKRVLRANQDGSAGHGADRVFRPVDKAQQVPDVEVLESIYLIAHRHHVTHPIHDLRRQRKPSVSSVERRPSGRCRLGTAPAPPVFASSAWRGSGAALLNSLRTSRGWTPSRASVQLVLPVRGHPPGRAGHRLVEWVMLRRC